MRYIGPYKIAHWLRKHGYNCQVIDFVTKMTEEQLYKLTKKFVTQETLMIGVSTTFMCIKEHTNTKTGKKQKLPEHVIGVLTKIRQEFPKLRVVLGGHGAELIDGHGVIDAAVTSYKGASEDVILEYVDALKKNTPYPHSTLIAPLSERDHPAPMRPHFFLAKNPKYNIELDDFRFHSSDNILTGEPLPLDISRGCIFKCRFCQFQHLGKKKLDYIRDMELIESELLYNYKNFGTTSYYVLDDTFNDTEIKLKSFLDMTKRLPFRISFVAYARADLIHRFPDMAYMLQESGMTGVAHGIESLHPHASKVIGKSWSGKYARDFIPKLYHDIWKNKVSMHTNFIVGLPGESPEHIMSTVDWFKENDLCSINFTGLYVCGPGNKQPQDVLSEFDKNAEQYGFTWGEYDPVLKTQSWTNDYWTNYTAVEFEGILNERAHAYRRMTPWLIHELKWLGHSKESLFNDRIIDMEFIGSSVERQQRFLQYYHSLYTQ